MAKKTPPKRSKPKPLSLDEISNIKCEITTALTILAMKADRAGMTRLKTAARDSLTLLTMCENNVLSGQVKVRVRWSKEDDFWVIEIFDDVSKRVTYQTPYEPIVRRPPPTYPQR